MKNDFQNSRFRPFSSISNIFEIGKYFCYFLVYFENIYKLQNDPYQLFDNSIWSTKPRSITLRYFYIFSKKEKTKKSFKCFKVYFFKKKAKNKNYFFIPDYIHQWWTYIDLLVIYWWCIFFRENDEKEEI